MFFFRISISHHLSTSLNAIFFPLLLVHNSRAAFAVILGGMPCTIKRWMSKITTVLSVWFTNLVPYFENS